MTRWGPAVKNPKQLDLPFDSSMAERESVVRVGSFGAKRVDAHVRVTYQNLVARGFVRPASRKL